MDEITLAIGALVISMSTALGCEGTASDRSRSSEQQIASGCVAPRYYSYPIPTQPLPCGNPWAELIGVDIPDEGHALARATLVMTDTNPDFPWGGQAAGYNWSAGVSVGDGEVAYSSGNDICPGSTSVPKGELGYGNLTSGDARVSVWAGEGAATCVDGTVALSSGTLEVWVEDPSPSCVGQDVGLASSYQSQYYGNQQPCVDPVTSAVYPDCWFWSDTETPVITLPVPSSSDRTQILVLGSIDGSPTTDPNTVCGQEFDELGTQLQTSDMGVITSDMEAIVASGGMGHLLLSEAASTTYDPSTTTSVSIWAGSSSANVTTIQTGGCCGDAKVGFVKMP
jgi:hypothetical protein